MNEPEAQESKYRLVINKDLLTEFFFVEEVTEQHLTEVHKVFNVIMAKYYAKYYYMRDDLISFAISAACDRKFRNMYDPSYSAYNYLFALFRNEVGNKILKLAREVPSDMLLSYRNLAEPEVDDTNKAPASVQKYIDALSGDKSDNFTKVAKADILDIIIYCRVHEGKKLNGTPEYLQDNNRAIPALYNIIKDLVGFEINNNTNQLNLQENGN